MLHRNLHATTSRKKDSGQALFMCSGIASPEFPVIGANPNLEQFPELQNAYEGAKKAILEDDDWEKAREILADTGFRTIYHEVEYKDNSQNAKFIRSFTIETVKSNDENRLTVTTKKPVLKVKDGDTIQKVTTPVATFRNILLHALRNGSWEIIGVNHNRTQEVIATLTAVTGQEQAGRLADQLARSLAGKPYADVD